MCPVLIHTGDLARRLRSESIGPMRGRTWYWAARTWGHVTVATSASLSVAAKLPPTFVEAASRILCRLLGPDTVPQWSRDLPGGGRRRRARSQDHPPASGLLPSVRRHDLRGREGDAGVAAALRSLADKAGVGLVGPQGVEGLCCGMPWKSKGLNSGYDAMITRTLERLWSATGEGRLPVVCDNSSCSEGLMGALRAASDSDPRHRLRFVDAVDFVVENLAPKLQFAAPVDRVAVHPTCSSTRAGSHANLLSLASIVGRDVTVPDDWGCCGFAGDRGMLHPELTASATRREARELVDHDHDLYVSCNRTCEIAMTRATGRSYIHVLEALDRIAHPLGSR